MDNETYHEIKRLEEKVDDLRREVDGLQETVMRERVNRVQLERAFTRLRNTIAP